MQTHKLKILPQYFHASAMGNKPFEVRKNDRDYKVGDYLQLQEWDGLQYTGRELYCYVSYMLSGGQFGIDKDYCVLGTRIINIIKGAK